MSLGKGNGVDRRELPRGVLRGQHRFPEKVQVGALTPSVAVRGAGFQPPVGMRRGISRTALCGPDFVNCSTSKNAGGPTLSCSSRQLVRRPARPPPQPGVCRFALRGTDPRVHARQADEWVSVLSDAQEGFLVRVVQPRHAWAARKRASRWTASLFANTPGPILLKAQRLLLLRAHCQSGSSASPGVRKGSTGMLRASNGSTSR